MELLYCVCYVITLENTLLVNWRQYDIVELIRYKIVIVP